MHVLLDALPEFLGALGSAAVIGMLLRRVRRLTRQGTRTAAPPAGDGIRAETDAGAYGPERRGIALAKARRYTLRDAVTDDSFAIQVMTIRPVGTLITQTLTGQEQHFELTDVGLSDGTFAAEPIDRCRLQKRILPAHPPQPRRDPTPDVFYREGRVYSVDTVQITDGLITAHRRVINPDKLVCVRTVTPGGAASSP
ncbi:hypothetical protein ACFT8W_00825 [Streptomyces hygroscopicus]|uniref:hypothetical protein n=1 Tax=Streptomyces hygroscopicus TaxID=1912 RepID=UPI00362EB09B